MTLPQVGLLTALLKKYVPEGFELSNLEEIAEKAGIDAEPSSPTEPTMISRPLAPHASSVYTTGAYTHPHSGHARSHVPTSPFGSAALPGLYVSPISGPPVQSTSGVRGHDPHNHDMSNTHVRTR